MASGDEYASNSKPQVDWDDIAAREELIDSRARDGYALLAVLDDRELDESLAEAAVLLATVLGQDLETTDDGVFRIARRVARTGSSPPWTRKPGTATRPKPAGSTATKGMSRPIRTARSPPTPRSAPATSVMPRSLPS